MVRLGIGLHGISAVNKRLKTVSTLKTTITQVKSLPAGETIGYNRREKLNSNSRIAIIPVGYADGIDRKFGNRNVQFCVKKNKVPLIGDVCMDMCMLDVTGINAEEGDEVIIFGKDNSITHLAQKINTIPYEILTSISERVKRVYIDE
jgi:alanine racemase